MCPQLASWSGFCRLCIWMLSASCTSCIWVSSSSSRREASGAPHGQYSKYWMLLEIWYFLCNSSSSMLAGYCFIYDTLRTKRPSLKILNSYLQSWEKKRITLGWAIKIWYTGSGQLLQKHRCCRSIFHIVWRPWPIDQLFLLSCIVCLRIILSIVIWTATTNLSMLAPEMKAIYHPGTR